MHKENKKQNKKISRKDNQKKKKIKINVIPWTGEEENMGRSLLRKP